MRFKVTLILFFLVLLSCSKSNKPTEDYSKYEEVHQTDYELFNEANLALQKKNYAMALDYLDKIEVLFPNGKYASKSKLMNGYIYFLMGEYEKTKAIAKNFIEYYPGNNNIIYANYLDAMTHYILVKKPNYDQKDAYIAKQKFNYILNAYETSNFHQDINFKLNVINNTIADHLLSVGKYYENKNNYTGALKYYTEILKKHETSIVIEESLYLITKIYHKLKEEKLAIKYASILGYNYPESKWYKKSYNLVKNIKEEQENKVWYKELNPIKLLKREKETNKDKKWYEPKKPKFSIF